MPNKKFQVPINLVNLSSDPVYGSEGDMYYNTVSDVVKVYANGVWTEVGKTLTQEETQDYVAPLFVHNNHTNASVTYEDALNEIHIDVINAPSAGYTAVVKHSVKLNGAIAKGQAVYVSSSNGTNMVVSKASNASEATSSKTMGLLETGGSNNATVNVVTEGLLAGLDTSTADTEGDPVWLGTNGNLIYGLTNKPYAPAHLVFIGIVTRKNQNNGEIFVKIQNGFELNELHTVGIGYNATIADNEVLAYDDATSLWINQTASEAGLATSTHNHTGVYQLVGSYLTSETDPVFLASPSYGITSTNITNWNTAYTDRNKWDGGATGLTAATGRTSLGLGTMAVETASNYATLSGATFTGAINGTSLTLSGDLIINGTTTTINSTTLSVDDKNIEIGSVASPTNTTADGGGITLKGTTDKTFNWVNSTSSWTSSENIDLASGKTLKINGVDVLSASNYTGNAANVTGTVGVGNGGTGQTSIPLATAWVSGTTYAVGDVVTYQTGYYVRRVAGAGTTAPSADTTNWAVRSQPATLLGAGTATNVVGYNSASGITAVGMAIGYPPATIPALGLTVSNGSITVSNSTNGITVSGSGGVTTGSGGLTASGGVTATGSSVIQNTGTGGISAGSGGLTTSGTITTTGGGSILVSGSNGITISPLTSNTSIMTSGGLTLSSSSTVLASPGNVLINPLSTPSVPLTVKQAQAIITNVSAVGSGSYITYTYNSPNGQLFSSGQSISVTGFTNTNFNVSGVVNTTINTSGTSYVTLVSSSYVGSETAKLANTITGIINANLQEWQSTSGTALASVNSNGVITASSFAGSGVSLTNLNGANITANSVPITALPAYTGMSSTVVSDNTPTISYPALTFPIISSLVYSTQPASTTIASTTTLTSAQIFSGMLLSSTASAYTSTLPSITTASTGMEAYWTSLNNGVAPPVNTCFEISFINTGTTNAWTITIPTGWTGVPATTWTIAAAPSATIPTSVRARIVKRSTTAYSIIRLS